MHVFSLTTLQELFTGLFWLVVLKSFTQLFLLSFLSTILVYYIFKKTIHTSTETHLRLCFFLVPTTFLLTFMAFNAPVVPVALYSLTLGAFLALLLVTHRVYHIVEENAVPSKADIAVIEHYHRNIRAESRNILKYLGDKIGALILLIVLSPLFLFLCVAVWINDPGSIFLAKHVVGRKGKPFRAYKVRSMIKNAEQHTGAVQVQKGDERIIWIGHFLRASHLDEFPQLWNVLRGEMSLVGPRPEKVVRVKHFLQDVPGYAERHTVLPGITGWAQVHHTYYTPPAEKMVYDLYYITHQSLWLDMKILLKTLPITAIK